MYMCATRFDLEEQELESIRQLLSKNEREALHEERDAENPEESVDPISDDEEDDLIPRLRRPEFANEIASQRAIVCSQFSHQSATTRENEEVIVRALESVSDDDDGDLPSFSEAHIRENSNAV